MRQLLSQIVSEESGGQVVHIKPWQLGLLWVHPPQVANQYAVCGRCAIHVVMLQGSPCTSTSTVPVHTLPWRRIQRKPAQTS
jgi:hypothetical protein